MKNIAISHDATALATMWSHRQGISSWEICHDQSCSIQDDNVDANFFWSGAQSVHRPYIVYADCSGAAGRVPVFPSILDLISVPADTAGIVVCPAISNCGRFIAFLSKEQLYSNVATISIREASGHDPEIVKSAVLHSDNVPTHLSFLPDDQALLVGDDRGRIRLLPIRKMRMARTMTSKDVKGYDQTSLVRSVSMEKLGDTGQVCLASAASTLIRLWTL